MASFSYCQLRSLPSSVCRTSETKVRHSKQTPASHRGTGKHQQFVHAPQAWTQNQVGSPLHQPSVANGFWLQELAPHESHINDSFRQQYQSEPSHVLDFPFSSQSIDNQPFWDPIPIADSVHSEQFAPQVLQFPNPHLNLNPVLGAAHCNHPMAAMVHRPSSTPANELQNFGLHALEAFNKRTKPRQQIRGPGCGMYLRSTQDGPWTGMQQSMHTNNLNPFIGYEDMHSPDDLGLSQLGHQQYTSDSFVQDGISTLPSDFSIKDESSSPLTPSTPSSDSVKRTRSGRAVGRDGSPQILRSNTGARVVKSPRVKAPRPKSTNTKAPKIDQPLSEVTKDMEIPIRDMEAWVNRPDSERMKEAAKRNGSIARPMNSFMLYRSAYSERTKAWCVQNNHQVVSAVSGESWPLEPQSVRDFYNELSRLERDNHAKAHPEYKFSPSKNGPASRRKKADLSDDEDSAASEQGDADSEYRPGAGRRYNRRQTRDSFSPSSFQNTFDHQYAANGFQAQPYTNHHFPGAVDSPGPHQLPYFQQVPQPYMQSPAQYMDMPMQSMQVMQMQNGGGNFCDMGVGMSSPSSYNHDFAQMQMQQMAMQQMQNMQMQDQMGHMHVDPQHGYGHGHGNFMPQSQEHSDQQLPQSFEQNDQSHLVDPSLLMNGDADVQLQGLDLEHDDSFNLGLGNSEHEGFQSEFDGWLEQGQGMGH